MPNAESPISPIPTPPDFPVEWANPGDERLYWTHDRMHFPDPLGPLTVSFEGGCFNLGIARAMAEHGLPVQMRYQAINGYAYTTIAPIAESPSVLAELQRQSEERIRAAAMRLRETWQEEILPELEADVAALRGFDYVRASDGALGDHLDWLARRRAHHWYLHFKIAMPMFGPIIAFEELYQRLFQTTDDTEPYTLLQGLPNKTVAGGHALWRLSREAAKSPVVRDVLGRAEPATLFAQLEETPEGREFASRFRAYLDEFGWRGDSWNMDDPTWVSYPRTPLNTLRGYLAQPDDASPELVHAELARGREAAVAAARQRLADAPPDVRGQFEGLLQAAQFSMTLQEDHNYYIDQMLQHLSRRALVEAGRRLVGFGQIAEPEDVLYLTFDEVRGSLRQEEHPDLRPIVGDRRAELTHWRTLTPPPALGTPPPAGARPPQRDRFWGDPPPVSTERSTIRGHAGSRGKVSGPARVALSLTEATQIQPGEILVCPTTAPPWTPVFATAAGIVTDTGGILSHCAVVAREYGIPAVVGTGEATRRIRTGQRITVDGAAGVVTLDEGASERSAA